ncbi:transposase [Nonlabens arenilitoris]|uniref:Transposase n=2 Tax=Nonlabens arenilitoris TaxID=1217969 RepID=A0A2S7UC95_9FLAO|nr:transposase [Nonlabens arenilitoris]
MKARYNRISTANQNLERQLAKQAKGETIYNDVISGSVLFNKRPKGQELTEDIKSGKITYVSVSSIDRLGRNLIDILQTVQFFTDNGVNLMVDNLGITSLIDGKPNSTFNLIISVMGNVAQMERETLLERQREGIAIAKAKGTYKGRVRGSVEAKEDFLSKYPDVIKSLKKGNSLRDTAKISECSLGTVQKVKQYLKTA